jgi:hypothetical protein
MERRTFLLTASFSCLQVGTLGCGGSSGDGPVATPAPSLPAPPVSWNPSPLLFIAGSNGSVDLASTLPAGVLRGGTFGLATNSSPLPPRLSLAPNGILSASAPVVGSAANIIFTYAEPA